MNIPSRASDAGPQGEPEIYDPLECVSLAGEYLDLYRKAKREALVNTPRDRWLIHLREAMRLLDRAEDLEIGAIEPKEKRDAA